jgi:hypothetical protein
MAQACRQTLFSMPMGARAPFGRLSNLASNLSSKSEEDPMKRIYGMAMLAALFVWAAAAQDAATQEMKKQLDETLTNLKQINTVIRVEGGVMSSVKNAPYRADQISETTQTLGDGTRIHNERQVTIYRDSQGRVRREMPNEISIMDPNSGVGYMLNTKDMTYRKMTVHVSVSSGNPGGRGLSIIRTGPAVFAGGGEDMPVLLPQRVTDGPSVGSVFVSGQAMTTTMTAKKETLGTQFMEGVSAQGERRTSTIETGAIGNDRPIQEINERWYSPDLQVEVMTRHSDPRTGEEITRLVNINRAEPDPSLFVVPAGYQMIEPPAGPFRFDGGRGGGQ